MRFWRMGGAVLAVIGCAGGASHQEAPPLPPLQPLPISPAEPSCTVPEPADVDANALLLERSVYAMSARRHLYLMRDGNVSVRISRAPADGGLVCRVARVTEAERDALVRLSEGLCQWPVGKDQRVVDQGRFELRVRGGAAPCVRNEAATSILPTWEGPDWSRAEPQPLPKWGALMKALDALEARVAPDR